MTPETRYARTTDRTHVAYKVSGDGPIDVLVMRAWSSNLDNEWRDPVLAGILRRFGAIGRVVHLDRRGTRQSDRIDLGSPPTLEQRIDDMRAVLDAIGSERVVLLGLAHASALCSVFAATYPERTAGLIAWSPPWTLVGKGDPALAAGYAEQIRTRWGTVEHAEDIAPRRSPSRAGDPAFVEWLHRDQVESGTAEDALAQWRAFIERVAGLEVESDRVLATVLFADIVGSTRMVDALGDRGWRDLLERHHRLVRRELARHRGREVDTEGDGFFAAFDGPARAIHCAASIRDGLRQLDLHVRIGLHAGECERAGGGLRGVAVHVGARIGGAAEADEILVSSTLRDLVAGSGIAFEDAGRHELKGVPDAWQLYRVVADVAE